MTNDWIYKLHIAIWLKKVSNDRLFANLQFCDFLIKVSYCSVHYRLHCTTFTRTHRQQFFKKDVKWLNLQTSHCNLTEKCHKRQTSCDFLLKLLTAVSTYIFAATAFTRTRGQQFLKKMSNDWIYKLHIAIWQKNVSNDKLLLIFDKSYLLLCPLPFPLLLLLFEPVGSNSCKCLMCLMAISTISVFSILPRPFLR